MELLNKLKIEYDDITLYEEALTHSSYGNENQVPNYERLEYLGDAVLELVISEYLYNQNNVEEGILTKMRANYVCENALYEYSIHLKLNEYLRLGKGEQENGGKYRKAVVADIFEAFVGAVFLDKGFDYVKKFIYTYIIPLIKNNNVEVFKDNKSTLQELVQTDKRSVLYKVIKEEGPAHNKTFEIIVQIDNITYGKGIAGNKKEAEQKAAEDALKKIAKI